MSNTFCNGQAQQQQHSSSEELEATQSNQEKPHTGSAIADANNETSSVDFDFGPHHQSLEENGQGYEYQHSPSASSQLHLQPQVPTKSQLPCQNVNLFVNENFDDDWLNDLSENDLYASSQGQRHGLREEEQEQLAEKHDNDSDNEKNTENDSSLSELEYDGDFSNDHQDHYDEGLMEATKLHQVGYFDHNGMPYSHGVYGATQAIEVNENYDENDNATKTIQQHQKRLNQPLNLDIESSDDDLLLSAFNFKGQGLHDFNLNQDQASPYEFKIDPTLDDDEFGSGSPDDFEAESPFYSVMDAFHSYTMRMRVNEANEKWGTGPQSTSIQQGQDEIRNIADKKREVKVQFSARVELYSVETPTDDEDQDDNENSRPQSLGASKSPVIHVTELRLEERKLQQIESGEIPPDPDPVENYNGTVNPTSESTIFGSIKNIVVSMPNPNQTSTSFPAQLYPTVNTDSNVDLVASGNPTPTTIHDDEFSRISIQIPQYPSYPCKRPNSVPLHFHFQQQPSSNCDKTSRPSSCPRPSSPSEFSSSVTKAAQSLSFKLGQSVLPIRDQETELRPNASTGARAIARRKSSPTETKRVAKTQLSKCKVKPKLQTQAPKGKVSVSVPETDFSQDLVEKGRETQRRSELTAILPQKGNGHRSDCSHSIGDHRKLSTTTIQGSASSASSVKSTSQEKVPHVKSSGSDGHGLGGAFTFATASDAYKCGLHKNSPTYTSFPPQPLHSGDAASSSGYGQAHGFTKINPILQSILDPKNLELLTKSCHQNSPVFKELKAQIVKHNVPKSLLQNRLSKKMINLLFDNDNVSSSKNKTRNRNECNGSKDKADTKAKSNNNTSSNTGTKSSVKNANIATNSKNKRNSIQKCPNQNQSKRKVTATNLKETQNLENGQDSAGTGTLNVSNLILNFQKETLSSKSKYQSSKKCKTKTTDNCIDKKERQKLQTLPSTPGNHFTGNTVMNINDPHASIISKWASRPEVIQGSGPVAPIPTPPVIKNLKSRSTCSSTSRPYSAPAKVTVPLTEPIQPSSSPVNKSNNHSHPDKANSIIKSNIFAQEHAFTPTVNSNSGSGFSSSSTSHGRPWTTTVATENVEALQSQSKLTIITSDPGTATKSTAKSTTSTAPKKVSVKLAIENYERQKSVLEEGFQSLGLLNNYRAMSATTALANSMRPQSLTSTYQHHLAPTSTGNKCNLPLNSRHSRLSRSTPPDPSNSSVLSCKVKC